MAQARTWSVGLVGVTGALVEVAVDDAPGAPALALVGLPDAVVRQSVDRVRAAVRRCGWSFPDGRVTISLSPAAMPKQGAGFDLALAVAALAATGRMALREVDRPVFLGEVGLDGSLRAVRGVLPGVLAARAGGFGTVVVPAANAAEAALVPGVTVLAAEHLREVVEPLRRSGATLAAQFALNAAVHRPRPTLYPHLVAAPGLSYPSGHTALAAALGTLAAVLAWRTRWRWPAVILALGYAVAMGTARVLLGVHNPSDVLAGWLLGLGMGLLAAWMGERVRRGRRATLPHR